jgi:hypothetical protein
MKRKIVFMVLKIPLAQTEQQIQYQQQRHQQLLQQQQSLQPCRSDVQQAIQEGEQDAEETQLLDDELALLLPQQEELEALDVGRVESSARNKRKWLC